MSNTTQQYTVRANKGRARIWIEGARLTSAGFTHHATYNVMATGNIIGLTLAPDGKRKVSGAPARPIIDLCGRSCSPFETGDDVEITYQNGTIIIERVSK